MACVQNQGKYLKPDFSYAIQAFLESTVIVSKELLDLLDALTKLSLSCSAFVQDRFCNPGPFALDGAKSVINLSSEILDDATQTDERAHRVVMQLIMRLWAGTLPRLLESA